MSWLENLFDRKNKISTLRASIPEGVWTKCTSCEQILYRLALEDNLEVCPKCDHHMRMKARRRLDSFLDKENRVEIAGELSQKIF